MRKFEIITKEITKAKLTVAKDRITLKIPPTVPIQERAELEALAHKIDLEVPAVEFTLRGSFINRAIKLSDRSTVYPTTWTY